MTVAVQSPLLIFIPGGPGLLSDSIADLLPHFSRHDYICADPIDDGGKLGYENLLGQLEVLLPRDRDVVLCGHSFGGILAGDMALRTEGVKALICMASPFSKRAWESVGDQYNRNATPDLESASELFERDPNDTNFRNWIANYGVLYFAPTNVGRGKEMLLNCKTNLKAFEESGAEASQKQYVLQNLKTLSIPKLFIAGDADQLVTVESARAEAEIGGFDLVEIENAGHF
ncbi:MAG: alpha/beta hydrolase, partial [Proteobacteria bacterium]